MASVETPPSPMSVHAVPSVRNSISKLDVTHLSGATMADLITEPHIHLVTASVSSSERNSVSDLASKRASVASTTKSQLRHTNTLLIDMLQNIQSELTAHRSIMLDIQHRVTHLEHDSVASVNNDDAQIAALHALEGRKSKRNSRLVPPEGQTWWEACQNFARNSNPPMSASEFLRTPKRFSGIDWQYGLPSARPNTPPATPPQAEDLPPLTPTSEDGEESDLDTPRIKGDADVTLDSTIASTPPADFEIEDDIKEHTVELNDRKLPRAPVLLAPPEGKARSVTSEEVITAVDPVDLVNRHRFYKGVRSLATYRAVMRNRNTEKEHRVLIHFHNRKQLEGLGDDV
ncbi:hypothetical protein EJ04DRAFT_574461 [Polyplosphaeria fusca]|uniref:Uncharacterized protein n=1 Tax=Polyplosphaeria fusca TaxID=682080 RepID=A0A9P4R660_9PLEO|nr:hypothetical protein EJ04DRAFT_574461 [Polyplosphaeria fusca]